MERVNEEILKGAFWIFGLELILDFDSAQVRLREKLNTCDFIMMEVMDMEGFFSGEGGDRGGIDSTDFD